MRLFLCNYKRCAVDSADSSYSLEDLGIEGFDIVSADGVVNLRLGSRGTYVLNKQTPTRQLWLSSPVSGPWHYEWIDGDCTVALRCSRRCSRTANFLQRNGGVLATSTCSTSAFWTSFLRLLLFVVCTEYHEFCRSICCVRRNCSAQMFGRSLRMPAV
jgi:frataxin-like iron-binding protein CyaY